MYLFEFVFIGLRGARITFLAEAKHPLQSILTTIHFKTEVALTSSTICW